MSLLSAEYLDHLRAQADQDDADIPAEDMTPEVLEFYDRLFDAAFDTPATKIKPVRKGTDVPPGPLRVAVYRQRFKQGRAIFCKDDLKWREIKARMIRKATKRHPQNGNPLADTLMTEKEVLDELRAHEAARKARRA